ncbi:ALK and LTK ligand 2 isoform X5 [Pan troglodytes]|nr:ALK and LTK ligand 2 isoform X5 [Pan troglodytes]XP_016801396.1 ALK and LTK ligand 2 isoform X5 [Pan troglodytes]
MKDKFLKHLTGPLYFSPKCSKHFHRLYHNTRDCTIPAYYKRCARLLTRLAVSPVCMEDKFSVCLSNSNKSKTHWVCKLSSYEDSLALPHGTVGKLLTFIWQQLILQTLGSQGSNVSPPPGTAWDPHDTEVRSADVLARQLCITAQEGTA